MDWEAKRSIRGLVPLSLHPYTPHRVTTHVVNGNQKEIRLGWRLGKKTQGERKCESKGGEEFHNQGKLKRKVKVSEEGNSFGGRKTQAQ